MNLLGIHLTLLIGKTIPKPAAPLLMEALQAVEVTLDDEDYSGFELTFQAGRSGPADLLDYALLSNPLLKPFNRVILIVRFALKPIVLMDGVITHQQLSPGAEPGAGTLTIKGKDVSVMMDLEEKPVEHTAQDESAIAKKIILAYSQYGLVPDVAPAPSAPPNPAERTPVQSCTDRAYLKETAERYGYKFYVTPGPAPKTSIAHWGPPERLGLPQRALSVNLGPETNVDSIRFTHDAEKPNLLAGDILDPFLNKRMPIQTFASTRLPLSKQFALVTRAAVRRKRFDQAAGKDFMQAMARAQGMTDASTDDVLQVTGELDALRYNGLLRPRGLVGLRGVGLSHDGLYYVKSVTHTIGRGQYKQSFTLTREGLGATLPVVIP
ncbi:MAG TPA: hypothetical protein VJG32_09740 [Anaerolineae bacterium]|nr:hypothetical protein [Anaerolineae bacterium]